MTDTKAKPMGKSMGIRLPDELYARLRAAGDGMGRASDFGEPLPPSVMARYILERYLENVPKSWKPKPESPDKEADE